MSWRGDEAAAWILEEYPQAAEIVDELREAEKKFPAFHSCHEGYAVLLEEVDELWDEIKNPPHVREVATMRAEAVQVAAMALRFIRDVCDRKEGT